MSRMIPTDEIGELKLLRSNHRLWRSEFLDACRKGWLSRDDFAFFFAQYYLYSKSFTRFLSAVAASCENDFYRARLTQNLWEEGGGIAPEKRHSEIFRRFLVDALGVDLKRIRFLPATRYFVDQMLSFCLHSTPLAGSAFLSLGTEGIVPDIYRIFIEGLEQVGIPEEQLEFFQLHIGCDDEHAETLEAMMCSYREVPGWRDRCLEAMNRCLDLRADFFDAMTESLALRRVAGLASDVGRRERPLPSAADDARFLHRGGGEGDLLYRNSNEAAGIQFRVERLGFSPDVLDPRLVRVAAGRSNELHSHAHETVIHVLEGEAEVRIGETSFAVNPGDTVFVPRWAIHQATAREGSDLVYFAVTDYGFASRAHRGDYLDGHRQQPENDRSARTWKR